MMPDRDAINTVLSYHSATKHHFHRYAPGPGHLDWATQPEPFRQYAGAPVLALEIPDLQQEPSGLAVPAPFDAHSVSRLFFNALAISAWKQAGDNRWALRVNPSSGNLHPTEGYLLSGPIPGLAEEPALYHYAPDRHALERRATFPAQTWAGFAAGWQPGTSFVGLSSIPWRESWKYGERAFRYCNHDVGHALAALAISARLLRWHASLVDHLATADLQRLLGLNQSSQAEPEWAEILVAISPATIGESRLAEAKTMLSALSTGAWQGNPNLLGPSWIDWPLIAGAVHATKKPAAAAFQPAPSQPNDSPSGTGEPVYPPKLIHQRRSAMAMDERVWMNCASFWDLLGQLLPAQPVFSLLPWSFTNLVFFVHRVREMAPGVYILVRNPRQLPSLKLALRPGFAWQKPSGCPSSLPFYRLQTADSQETARLISCHQEIASDGCFSLAMVAEFEEPITRLGAWMYPRLFWECGMIGQILYLAAEKIGLRGTGIGCFFDDAMHQLLGLESQQFQSLYHFTVGSPLEDHRLTTLPPYS
jgi:SagB-type dehydrogenase family enzyme